MIIPTLIKTRSERTLFTKQYMPSMDIGMRLLKTFAII